MIFIKKLEEKYDDYDRERLDREDRKKAGVVVGSLNCFNEVVFDASWKKLRIYSKLKNY